MALTMYKQVDIQLMDQFTRKAINASGGVAQVLLRNSGDKQAIYEFAEPHTAIAASANPIALSNGRIQFAVLSTVLFVDIAILCPGGQFVFAEDVAPGEYTELFVDTQRKLHTYKIGFSHADSTAAAEQTTGFDLPYGVCVQPNPRIFVVDVDATETLDVGIDSGGTAGDANGFLDTVSVATAGIVKGTLLASGDTMGALLSVLDSANAGDDAPEQYPIVSANEQTITYTTTAGSDTCSGYILLDVLLP